MSQLPQFGPNKTGAMSARERGQEMLEGIEEFVPEPAGMTPNLAIELIEQASEDAPIGHVPPPLEGEDTDSRLALLMDKLGERLAFERTGVRLYQGVLDKLDAYGSFEGGPTEVDLLRIRDEELIHFQTLDEIIASIGGDPTAITPSANVTAVMSMGLCQVVGDPRTNLVQSLEAMMVAELVDTECWENLVDLARSVGRDDVADVLLPFAGQEESHREQLRRWMAAAQLREPFAH
jgi:rubrerythrin